MQMFYRPFVRCFLTENAAMYAKTITKHCGLMVHCFSFIDGTVIGMDRPGDYDMKHAAYNGHTPNHALKFETISTPDGLILHAQGPLAGYRHNWALYMPSEAGALLDAVCNVNGEQLFIHGDTGYNHLNYLEIPFSGAKLSVAK